MLCYDHDDDTCSDSIYSMYLLERVHLVRLLHVFSVFLRKLADCKKSDTMVC